MAASVVVSPNGRVSKLSSWGSFVILIKDRVCEKINFVIFLCEKGQKRRSLLCGVWNILNRRAVRASLCL